MLTMFVFTDHCLLAMISDMCKRILKQLRSGLWNYLSLNPSTCKCKYNNIMLISRKRMPNVPNGPLLLGNCPLMFLSILVFYYLKTCHGLLVSRQSAQEQSKSLGYYNITFTLVPKHSHNSMSRSFVLISIKPVQSAWAPHMAKDIQAIENVQKFACRMAMHL